MKRAEKQAFVEEFRARVEEAPVVYLTDFTGLDVQSMTVLRQELKKSGAEYLVVKNRLAKRALAQIDGYPDLDPALRGPTGVVFAYEGPVGPAKAVAEFAEEHDDRPTFKLGVLERDLLEPEQIERLAELPPREALLSQLVTALQAPLSALAGALQGKLQEVGGLLDALEQKKREEQEE